MTTRHPLRLPALVLALFALVPAVLAGADPPRKERPAKDYLERGNVFLGRGDAVGRPLRQRRQQQVRFAVDRVDYEPQRNPLRQLSGERPAEGAWRADRSGLLWPRPLAAWVSEKGIGL